VKVVALEIDNPISDLVQNIGVVNVPLGRHDPIETLRPGRNLYYAQLGQHLLYESKRAPHTLARNAATDGEIALRKFIDLVSDFHD
jgi:hypothetical protein